LSGHFRLAMEEEMHNFASLDEAVNYWRKTALEYKRKYHESKDELEEFQVNSRELEAELEAQLEQAETQNKELKILTCRLQTDCDSLRDRLENIQNETNRTIIDLQKELHHHKTQRDSLVKYVRDLEQTNDDLERAKRAAVVSLEDFETRLNQAIERNAFLESELDDKEAMAITVQRLKDEARDLRYELQIRHRQATPPPKIPDNDLCCDKIQSPVDSNKLTTESETQTVANAAPANTQPGSPVRCPNNQICSTNSPLTPSARISALNIVGDLLRKVGALESKLASCRNFVKDPPTRYPTKQALHNSPSKFQCL